MQNLVLLMEPSKYAHEIDLKCGNMCLNRFSIDEKAAFELSGIHYLKEGSNDILFGDESKGKGYLIII